MCVQDELDNVWNCICIDALICFQSSVIFARLRVPSKRSYEKKDGKRKYGILLDIGEEYYACDYLSSLKMLCIFNTSSQVEVFLTFQDIILVLYKQLKLPAAHSVSSVFFRWFNTLILFL